ncbi:MAG TPA: dihydrolipoyl dehydrogenase [Trueperaceae bacterium]|nr:dihydrolipoyl dehydrogenase [Trueperaceae bacterium]
MPKHDIVVVGAGPGGYVAAIRGAQLGFDVAVVEKEEALGGTCVRVGCIPSKALLESSERYRELREQLADHGITATEVGLDLAAMQARKERVVKQNTDGVAYLFKKNEITRYRGLGELKGEGAVIVHGDDGDEEVTAEHVVLATGSVPVGLPGVELDYDRIGTSTEALAYGEVPDSLVVIGAGYIGLELGSVWSRLGAQVTVLEYFDRILPGMDLDTAKEALKIFKRQGLTFKLGARVTGASVAGKGKNRKVTVEVEGEEPIEAARVLVAAGRRPATDGLGLEAAGVELDERGRVKVEDGFRTTAAGIYAIGDVIAGPMLAHRAEEDGVALMERLAAGPDRAAGHVDYDLVPGIVYTDPEIATVGRTEEQLEESGVPYRKGVFPFSANGRARAIGKADGRVKILAHQETDRVLGVHIIGPRAGDLIAEAVAAMTFGASAEDLARTVHAHPTLAEAVKEAALAVDGRAVHL